MLVRELATMKTVVKACLRHLEDKREYKVTVGRLSMLFIPFSLIIGGRRSILNNTVT